MPGTFFNGGMACLAPFCAWHLFWHLFWRAWHLLSQPLECDFAPPFCGGIIIHDVTSETITVELAGFPEEGGWLGANGTYAATRCPD